MNISIASSEQAEAVFSLISECKVALEKEEIYQWYEEYPTFDIVESDIDSKHLWVAQFNNKLLGIVTINCIQDPEWETVAWNSRNKDALSIHRLCVNPSIQKRGIGSRLLLFAENLAVEKDFKSMRLDVYSGNLSAINFYTSRNYEFRGEVWFPGRKLPFFCYEKNWKAKVEDIKP